MRTKKQVIAAMIAMLLALETGCHGSAEIPKAHWRVN
jgi:hypothetical protein